MLGQCIERRIDDHDQGAGAAGFAAAGNASPADILVLVTDRVTGRPVTTLAQANFVVINHFSHPGQTLSLIHI